MGWYLADEPHFQDSIPTKPSVDELRDLCEAAHTAQKDRGCMPFNR